MNSDGRFTFTNSGWQDGNPPKPPEHREVYQALNDLEGQINILVEETKGLQEDLKTIIVERNRVPDEMTPAAPVMQCQMAQALSAYAELIKGVRTTITALRQNIQL